MKTYLLPISDQKHPFQVCFIVSFHAYTFLLTFLFTPRVRSICLNIQWHFFTRYILYMQASFAPLFWYFSPVTCMKKSFCISRSLCNISRVLLFPISSRARFHARALERLRVTAISLVRMVLYTQIYSHIDINTLGVA